MALSSKVSIKLKYAVHSKAIPERLGFTYEATLRQCEWL
jgi:ribosomal-protein-serine acetyltransferase